MWQRAGARRTPPWPAWSNTCARSRSHRGGNDGRGGMRIVIALGGNALLKRGEPPTVETQRRNARRAAQSIATIAPGNELILTHGNGPQIGLLALQREA